MCAHVRACRGSFRDHRATELESRTAGKGSGPTLWIIPMSSWWLELPTKCPTEGIAKIGGVDALSLEVFKWMLNAHLLKVTIVNIL